MTEFETRAGRAVEADRAAIERLAENIRLTSLNMAMNAAKLGEGDDSKRVIRNKVRELISLSMEAVEHVNRALRAIESEQLELPDGAQESFAELKRMESTIVERTGELLKLLGGGDPDTTP